MSVRNQHAKNYYKVAPMPMTSNQLVDARNAIIRRNMYRAPDQTDDCNNKTAINTASDSVRNSDVKEIKSEREAVGMLDARTTERSKKDSDTRMYSKQEPNKGTSKTSLYKTNDLSQTEIKGHKVKQKEIKTKVIHEQLKDTSDDMAQSRPKSARPDSRWQRRAFEDIDYISDDDFEDDLTSTRPKSTRPESRIIRIVKSENVADVSERPKTSHRRQKSAQDYTGRVNHKPARENEHTERPKSRRGNAKDTSSDKSNDSKPKLPDDSTRRRIQSLDEEGDVVFHDTSYHIGISTFYPDLLDKIHGIDDINVQIDDIDLNVDPVLFFMQDNNNSPEKNSRKRSSLSKDAINVITNEKNSRQNKASNGFQGNNQNKRNSAPEVIDRFHRNKILNLQNTISNDNQLYSNHGRHERIKSDSLIGNSPITGEKIYISRTNTSNVESLSSVGVLRTRDSDVSKQSSNYDLSVQKYNINASRKPRKLKPLPPPGFEE